MIIYAAYKTTLSKAAYSISPVKPVFTPVFIRKASTGQIKPLNRRSAHV